MFPVTRPSRPKASLVMMTMIMIMVVMMIVLPWDQSSLAPELSHVESIVVHFTKHCDYVAGAERKLNL